MLVATKTEKYCPCCGTELAEIKISKDEKEDQCFNCGYTKSNIENIKEGVF